MKVKKLSSSVLYSMEELDDNELIPEGATNVMVECDENGVVSNVFYSKQYTPFFASNKEEYAKRITEGEALNQIRLSSEEMKRVASLLERMSNDESV